MLKFLVLCVTFRAIQGQIMMDRTLNTDQKTPLDTIDLLSGELDLALSAEQMELNDRCARKCKTESCYLADPNDCRNFVVCTQLPGLRKQKRYFGTTQKCAFGTFWGGFHKQQKVTCDLPGNVFCNIDYCRGRVLGEKFDHSDGNCKTFWECGSKGPVPKCCLDGQRYNRTSNTCEQDYERRCRDVCPIKIDACLTLGQMTDFFDDGNCRTFWDCEDRRPHPVCCPEGKGYVRNEGCVDMPGCREYCPKQYEPVCHLRPAPEPTHYIVDVHGTEMMRPCAPGTMFDLANCTCARKVKNAPDNSCTMELDIDFDAPVWDRKGSQNAATIEQQGTILEGPKLNGRTAYRFDGDLFFRMPFFKSGYDDLYINIIYQTGPSIGGKQVILTNCMMMDIPTPSLELYLENGMIHLSVITDEIIANQSAPVVAAVPFTSNVWNKFTAIYDGRLLSVINEGSEAPNVQEQSLSGTVVVAAEGLDIGGCWINRELGENFTGSVSKLQFSKCLKQDWVNMFREAITGPL